MMKLHRSLVDCTEKDLGKQMLLYAVPILFGTFFQQLYNTVDAVVIGKFAGKVALAAVGGGTSSIINFLVTFFVGLANGASVIVAQGYGANNRNCVHQAVHTGIALSIFGGACLTVIGSIITVPALGWMDTPAEIVPLAKTYMYIYFAGTIPNLVYNIGAAILRAVGDSRRPLYFLIVACFVNIGLDLIFVVWFNWGVFGVALATVISQLISAILVMYTLLTTTGMHRLELKNIRFHKQMLSRIVKIGIPSGLQNSLYGFSHLLIQSSVNAFGTDTVAAWTAFTKVDIIYWMIAGAFQTAVLTFCGQFFGAGKYDMMKKTMRKGTIMICITAISVSTLVCLFGDVALSLFLDDPNVIALGMPMFYCISATYLLATPQELVSSVCRSAGETLRPTIITGLGVCGFRILWILFLLPQFYSRPMLYLCYPTSWFITGIALTIYYFKGNWLQKHIGHPTTGMKVPGES